ncbi:hypothetical protein AcV5_001794 [Taiwanofungus camphoratus]|nr:hypothetical protein AcV5_001794 [Antrodia cinnamomea]
MVIQGLPLRPRPLVTLKRMRKLGRSVERPSICVWLLLHPRHLIGQIITASIGTFTGLCLCPDPHTIQYRRAHPADVAACLGDVMARRVIHFPLCMCSKNDAVHIAMEAHVRPASVSGL